MWLEVDLATLNEKLEKSLPHDADGYGCFSGDKVQIVRKQDNTIIHATLDVDDYMNWAFVIDKEDFDKADKFFHGERILSYGTFIDVYFGDWEFYQD